MRGFKYQVEVLEQKYTELEYKCKAQEATIERLSKNYYELKKWHDKATELIDVAARCMDDCDYAMTKVSNDRVEEAISVWNKAYNQFKGGADRMTDKEIIKAAKYCGGCVRQCDDCKLYENHDCTHVFAKYIMNHNPTTITREAAIDRLRELGWLQEHDKELTETSIRIGYDAAIMERASIAEAIEQVRREHKEEEQK